MPDYTATVTAPVGSTYPAGQIFSGTLNYQPQTVSFIFNPIPGATGLQSGIVTATSITLTSPSVGAGLTFDNGQGGTPSTTTLTLTSIVIDSGGGQLNPPTVTRTGATANTGTTLRPTSSLSATPASSSSLSSSSSSSLSPLSSSATSSSSSSSTATSTPASTAPASSAPASARLSSQNHSTGELVGVAIGVLIAGAFIAAIVVFVIMKRRAKKHVRRYDLVNGQPLLKEIGRGAVNNDGSWQKHLPQSESDHTISRAATELLDQIELHVENFYTDKIAVTQNPTAERSTQLLAKIISSGSRTIPAIKTVMITMILSSINYSQADEYSLLPSDFNTARMRNGRHNPGFDQAISQWRILTAYLESDALRAEAYLSERDAKISMIANELCRSFRPWARGDHNDCFRSTNGILKRGSELGAMLFSQPASFIWVWTVEASLRSKQEVVMPGLVRVTDANGRPLTNRVQIVRSRTEG